MNLLASFVSGLALAPILEFFSRLIAETTQSAATARVVAALALGVGASIAALLRLPAEAGQERRRFGSGLLSLAVLAPVPLASALTSGGPALAALPCVVFAVALALLGGPAPMLAPAALGGAVGLLGWAGFVAPRMGLAVPLAFATVLLGISRLARRAPASVDGRAPLVELVVAGLAIGLAFEGLRPFAMQHVSGASFSHSAFAAVALFAIGAVAIIPLPRPCPAALRVVFAVAFCAAAWWTVRVVAGASNVRVLASIPYGSDDDERIAELVRLRVLVGPLAVAAGLWAKSLFGAPLARRVAVFCLALGAGAASAHVAIDRGALTPERIEEFVRGGLREFPLRSKVLPDGVLRLVNDPSMGEGATRLMWQGRDASRSQQFAALESEELRLAALLAGRGSVLVVGNVLAAHRSVLDDLPFEKRAFAPTLASLEDAARPDEIQRSLVHPAAGARFDAIVLLAPASFSPETARVYQQHALRRFADALAPGGVLLVWLDLCSATPATLAGVARALEGVNGRIRAWSACDGWVGPFVAIEAGDLPTPRGAGRVESLAQPLDPRTILSLDDRTATLLDPIADTARPRDFTRKTIGDGGTLRSLAAAIERGGSPAIAALFDALAAHSDAYLDRTFVASPAARDVIPDAEVAAMVRALSASKPGSDERTAVMAQVRRFLLAAYAKLEYEKLDRVLIPVLKEYPDDTAFHLLAGKAAFDLLDDDTAIEELEIAVRGDKSQVDAFTILGRAYTRKQDFASALSALQSAQALAPDRMDVVRAMGMALLGAGRGAEAAPYLERVTLAIPNDKEAAAALVRARQ